MLCIPDRILRILAVFLFCITFSFQAFADKEINAVEKIMQESDGKINIDIPESILEGILQSQTGKKGNELKSGINKISGFRIQVFSDGRNQNTLESRAKARGNVILSRFPKYKGQVYTFSSSPNWYTRIGNFRTQAEANSALTELKKAFPGFASEMRVVKSQIIVVKQ
ncbi:MAG: SPOR domain-containing protein [Muribaculaceae bacterium]|nr:SPOR domain-containing protein [Muribaculaceae bacterium]